MLRATRASWSLPQAITWLKCVIISFKIFPQFWLPKSTCIIHHNQLVMSKFGRILCLTRKWRQKCSSLLVKVPLPRRPGDEVELFWMWKRNGGHPRVCFCSQGEEAVMKMMVHVARADAIENDHKSVMILTFALLSRSVFPAILDPRGTGLLGLKGILVVL